MKPLNIKCIYCGSKQNLTEEHCIPKVFFKNSDLPKKKGFKYMKLKACRDCNNKAYSNADKNGKYIVDFMKTWNSGNTDIGLSSMNASELKEISSFVKNKIQIKEKIDENSLPFHVPEKELLIFKKFLICFIFLEFNKYIYKNLNKIMVASQAWKNEPKTIMNILEEHVRHNELKTFLNLQEILRLDWTIRQDTICLIFTPHLSSQHIFIMIQKKYLHN